MAQKMTTIVAVLFLIGFTLEASSSVGADAVVDACYKECTKYKKEDPERFAVCEKACGFEKDVRKADDITKKCNESCQAKKDAVEIKACMEQCKIMEDISKVKLMVGTCYAECVTFVKHPAEFKGCTETCARVDKEGPQLVKDNALGRIWECNKRCNVEHAADTAQVHKCKESCVPAKP